MSTGTERERKRTSKRTKRERTKLPQRSDAELQALPDHAFVIETEAARLLRLSPASLTMRRQRGEPPRHVRFGRLIRYRVSELRRMGGTP